LSPVYSVNFLISSVVYFNGIIADSKATNRYAEVLEAVIYNEKGEKMDFYSDEISNFLEEME